MYRIILTLIFVLSSTILSAQTSHTCPSCGGSGKRVERCSNSACHNGAIYCTRCDYTGYTRSTCYNCSGQGYKTKEKSKVCSECRGSRYTKMEKQVSCTCRNGKVPKSTNQGTIYVNCSRCNGRGYKIEYYNAACRYCGGSGYRGTETVREKCTSCNGSGSKKETCSKCGGKGCYVCPTCHGYANVEKTCGRCNGSGRVYTH